MPTLNWIGKEKVINHHQDVSYRILEKQYSYSNGKEDNSITSENKIIHGDNLEALKSLLPEYEGKIKCIYIDPPYNTGNEGWVYNDNVNHPKLNKWLGEVVGKESEDLSRHDKWLCMMYPRLKLLNKLLREDGAIFISIDENELTSLRLLCSEIFGKSNYVATLTVIVKPEGRRYGFFAKTHEYLLVFAKNHNELSLNEISVEGKKYDYFDDTGGFFLKGLRNRNVKAFNSTNRPNLRYPFYVDVNNPDKDGLLKVSTEQKEDWIKVLPSINDGLESVWRWGSKTASLNEKDLTGTLGKDGSIRIFQKERKLTQIAKTTWDDKYFHSIRGTKELAEILGKSSFDFPKPESLIRQILTIGTNKDDIVLDSFAGSGTTAHAVLKLNKEDEGRRKFIIIEMESYAKNVTARRIEKAIKGYNFKGEKEKIFSRYTVNTKTIKSADKIIKELEQLKSNTNYSKLKIALIDSDIGLIGKEIISEEIIGTGGDFTYYELGQPIFSENELLNEVVEKEKIEEYVWYTETKTTYTLQKEDYLLGSLHDTAYYFYYEKERLTTLDESYLRTLKTKAQQYIIFADLCLLDKALMDKYHIIFKKIPRDISRF